MKLPDIPITYMMSILIAGLIVMRCFGIDSFTTAGLSIVIGYLFGVKQEQIRQK